MTRLRDFASHEHSVIDVCMRLMGAYRGTGDGISAVERLRLTHWLRRRVCFAWTKPTIPDALMDRVDDAVHELAVAVLAVAAAEEMPAEEAP